MYPAAERRFVNINRITIVFLFLVITAGGTVRSTGSGMGCPDWPKCFNQVIPPTDVSQLPDGYEQQYIEGRAKKNERFANIVEAFGFKDEANQIRHDESILQHEEFNAVKTWTEYINRLVGVIVGFCLLFTAIFSLTYAKSRTSITIWSCVNLLVVILQAWLGSIVVSTNLMPWIITVHMVLALVILAISIYTFYIATTLRDKSILSNHNFRMLKPFAILSLIVLFIQVVYGTEVRETVDVIKTQDVDRVNWIALLGQQYQIHRILGYVALGMMVILFLLVKSCFHSESVQSKYAWIGLLLVLVQVASGVVLARFALPPPVQTVHLVIGSLYFGALFYLMLVLSKAKVT